MKPVWLFIFLFCCLHVTGQHEALTERNLNMKLDSILIEGNLLYSYEKATWIAYDLAWSNPLVKKKFESYLTYQTGKAIKTIILGNNLEKCVAEYTFITDYDIPDYTLTDERPLSDYEKKLIYIRERILDNLESGEYDIRIPEGYNLNFILLPYGKKYKFYLLTGTSQSEVIPFGNDYLFIANEYGHIEKWRKFHAEFIPVPTTHEGSKVSRITHSHIKDNPLMSATDICTFMLYAPLYDLMEFSVYSEGKYMVYDMETNTIEVKDKP